MTTDENPYASPQAELLDRTAVEDADLDRMPSSVMVAVGCVGFFLLEQLFYAAYWARMTHELPLSAFVLGLPAAWLLVGLIQGNRLTWRAARLLLFLGAVLSCLPLLVIVDLLYQQWYPSPPLTDPNSGDPILYQTFFPGLTVMLAITSARALLMVASTFSLGRPTARQYFNLYCPNCQSRRVKAADFLFRKARCKECGNVW